MWAWGPIVLVVILLLLIRTFAPGAFALLTAPVWSVGNSLDTTAGGFFAGFENKAKLSEQNVALEQQVQTLAAENLTLSARAQDLAKLLGGTSGVNNEITVGVLARPPESPYDTLTIAAGAADGITQGALVYAASSTPIGTIQNVTANTSQVSLFSTTGRSTSGWLGTERFPVTLVGEGAGAFTATIPASTTVAVGDTVYVPGPGALPIGTVVKLGADPSSPTETIFIQPLVNLFSITWVEVARP